ncbi:hypothetical protein LIMNO130_30573 [Limnobacter sp. 130]|nr:hypothetical protein LIMNO130_30573 [Limnobacter sp. 130]
MLFIPQAKGVIVNIAVAGQLGLGRSQCGLGGFEKVHAAILGATLDEFFSGVSVKAATIYKHFTRCKFYKGLEILLVGCVVEKPHGTQVGIQAKFHHPVEHFPRFLIGEQVACPLKFLWVCSVFFLGVGQGLHLRQQEVTGIGHCEIIHRHHTIEAQQFVHGCFRARLRNRGNHHAACWHLAWFYHRFATVLSGGGVLVDKAVKISAIGHCIGKFIDAQYKAFLGGVAEEFRMKGGGVGFLTELFHGDAREGWR